MDILVADMKLTSIYYRTLTKGMQFMIMKYKGSVVKDPCNTSSFHDKVVLTAAEWLIQQNITVLHKGHHMLQVVNSILQVKLALTCRCNELLTFN